jgi:hypothetical protein
VCECVRPSLKLSDYPLEEYSKACGKRGNCSYPHHYSPAFALNPLIIVGSSKRPKNAMGY